MNACRILLVDDEEGFRSALEKRLRKRGMVTAEAGNGLEALDQLEAAPFDVVLLDVRMPGMNGIQALAEIRKRHPLVQVILLSAQVDVDVAIEGMEQGAFDYLMKPADMAALLYKIQDAVQHRLIQAAKMKALERAVDMDD